ncbi:MAG: polymerase subunit sigma-70, partial [Rhizobiaceae bacterium]|nr:polymerase subunit sigma-70 [Rhizobiaceae bacterium]
MTTMPLARNMTSIGRLDIPGGGQISVHDGYAYIGHMKPPHGTSIIDVRNPKDPKLVSTIALPDETSHTHKLRV